jgi:nucleolar GTP-binding protein
MNETQFFHFLFLKVALFNSIKPLFANKPLVVVLNKVDVRRPEQLSSEEQEMIRNMIQQTPGADLIHMSAVSDENITAVKELVIVLLFLFLFLA